MNPAVLSNLSYGMYVIGTKQDGRPNACVATSVVQVSSGSPTYIPPEKTFDKSSGESFVCSVCGYVYSDPNFSFEELRDNWTCPVCKMPKKAFVRRTY